MPLGMSGQNIPGQTRVGSSSSVASLVRSSFGSSSWLKPFCLNPWFELGCRFRFRVQSLDARLHDASVDHGAGRRTTRAFVGGGFRQNRRRQKADCGGFLAARPHAAERLLVTNNEELSGETTIQELGIESDATIFITAHDSIDYTIVD